MIFAKTRELKPGESQTLTMTIPVRDLASFDEAGSQWLTEAGTYTFHIGEYTLDRNGVLTGPRNSQLLLTLDQDGYRTK